MFELSNEKKMGRIDETGIYKVTVANAYETLSETTGSKALTLELVTDGGQDLRENIWFFSGKNNSVISFAQNTIQYDIMGLAGLTKLEKKPNCTRERYNYDTETTETVVCEGFPELIRKRFTVLVSAKPGEYNGKPRTEVRVEGWYDYKTARARQEIVKGIDAPALIYKSLDKLEKANSVARSEKAELGKAMTSSFSDNDDSDIPF